MLIIAVLLVELANVRAKPKLDAKYRFDQKKWNVIIHKNLLSHKKMSKDILTFDNIEIGNMRFTAMKVLFLKRHVDIEKLLVSSKISSGERNYKYSIGY